jgi:hypothetical protein
LTIEVEVSVWTSLESTPSLQHVQVREHPSTEESTDDSEPASSEARLFRELKIRSSH